MKGPSCAWRLSVCGTKWGLQFTRENTVLLSGYSGAFEDA